MILLVSGCSTPNPLADQDRAGENKNYIAGDGSVTEYPPEKRGEPLTFTATATNGERYDSDMLRGNPNILNFWYSGCPPCRQEAPVLEKINKQFKPQNLTLLAVNIRDSATTARAFADKVDLSAPIIIDKDAGGSVLLSVSSYMPTQAIPTTLVLDRQGRVAVRIQGAAQEGTLKSLLTNVFNESGPSSGPTDDPSPG